MAFGSVGAIVTIIAGMSLFEQITPVSASTECVRAWPYMDAGCSRDGNVTAIATRSIRVIGLDRTAPAVVATAAPSEVSVPAVPAITPAIVAIAAAPEPARESAVEPTPSTDGSGRVAVVEQAQPSMPLSEEDLTFKAGASRRSGGAVAAKTDAAPKKPATPRKSARVDKPQFAKSQRTAPQIYELPDGRRITVYRGEGADGRRQRAAEAGRRYGEAFSSVDGERRGLAVNSGGFGGLY
jgi:hypothetical protein